jgi:hypothetical protein
MDAIEHFSKAKMASAEREGHFGVLMTLRAQGAEEFTFKQQVGPLFRQPEGQVTMAFCGYAEGCVWREGGAWHVGDRCPARDRPRVAAPRRGTPKTADVA